MQIVVARIYVYSLKNKYDVCVCVNLEQVEEAEDASLLQEDVLHHRATHHSTPHTVGGCEQESMPA